MKKAQLRALLAKRKDGKTALVTEPKKKTTTRKRTTRKKKKEA